jgi:hypothetical protein
VLSHESLSALLIRNGDADLCIEMRRRDSLTSAWPGVGSYSGSREGARDEATALPLQPTAMALAAELVVAAADRVDDRRLSRSAVRTAGKHFAAPAYMTTRRLVNGVREWSSRDCN